MKPLRLTAHAERVLRERELSPAWVEAAVRDPEWVEPDPVSGAERRFRHVPERTRVLRVVCREDEDAVTVITAFLDRRARRLE